MNKEMFRSMQEQLCPSVEVRAELTEKLASAKKKTVPVGRYAAIAACAAVLVAAYPVYGAFRACLTGREVSLDPGSSGQRVTVTKPHSYAAVMIPAEACWPADAGAPESNTVTGGAGAWEGDRDQDMTPGELTDNMLESGFSQEDVDGYLASGWQMTWAKWWKFYHMAEESGEWTLESLLEFSENEGLSVNTGEAPVEIPGGAFVGDSPDQGEAVMAYQNLMARFEADYGPGVYPEWYGGAYIDGHASLIVNIVVSYEERLTDKELYLQIWDWAGSDRVAFSSSELSMNQLKDLQENVIAVMEALGLEFGCGINEETGQVELTLYHYNEDALWELARLDPADTAIDVLINDMEDLLPTEEPVAVAPSVSHSSQPGGAPAPGAADDDGAIAYEPQG